MSGDLTITGNAVRASLAGQGELRCVGGALDLSANRRLPAAETERLTRQVGRGIRDPALSDGARRFTTGNDLLSLREAALSMTERGAADYPSRENGARQCR